MRTLKLIVFGMVLFLAGTVQAQISVRFNIGSAPQWAPVEYADAHYYYLPDVEAYYDVQSSMFIYLNGRTWVHRTYLPYRYRNYDLYRGYKVAMNNYHGNTPYTNFSDDRIRYSKGHNREVQKTIGERPERGNYSAKYYRDNNQVNRGRGKSNDMGGYNYEKKNEHGNGKGNNKRK
ncbi:MAG: hypothetical protein M1445_04765 [Bacteroidetes bacterium]|nr:hypothetical protein [Bacteroidota bacterium]